MAARQPRDVALIASLPPGQLPKHQAEHRASVTRQVENVTKVVVVSDRSFGAVGGHVIWFWPERMGGGAQGYGAGEPGRWPVAQGTRRRW